MSRSSLFAYEEDEYAAVDPAAAPRLGCLLPVAAFVLAVIASVAFAEERPDKPLPAWPKINRPYQLTTGLTNDIEAIVARAQAAEARLAELTPTPWTPRKIGPEETLVVIEHQSFDGSAPVVELGPEGKPVAIVMRHVRSAGPLVISRGASSDTMRAVTLVLDHCAADCGYRAKAVHLDCVAIQRATITGCQFIRCEKAAIQLGEADLHQPRRGNITIRDTLIDGVIDREGDDAESHGVFILACQGVLLDNVTVRNIASREGRDTDCEGIYTKARDVLIDGCRLHDAGLTAITIKGIGEPADPDPLHCRYGDRVTVRGCTVTTSEAYRELPTRGVLIDCGGSVTVDDNTIRGGVVVDQPDGATGDIVIARNTITDPGGLAVEVRKASRPLTIVGNVGIGVRKVVGARVWPEGSVADNGGAP